MVLSIIAGIIACGVVSVMGIVVALLSFASQYGEEKVQYVLGDAVLGRLSKKCFFPLNIAVMVAAQVASNKVIQTVTLFVMKRGMIFIVVPLVLALAFLTIEHAILWAVLGLQTTLLIAVVEGVTFLGVCLWGRAFLRRNAQDIEAWTADKASKAGTAIGARAAGISKGAISGAEGVIGRVRGGKRVDSAGNETQVAEGSTSQAAAETS